MTTPSMKCTSAFFEPLAGYRDGSSEALSPSESDLELLSESLELADSSTLECAALKGLQKHPDQRVCSLFFV